MDNQKFNNSLKTPQSNWKYILIIVILAFFVGGGILIYQYWWVPRQEVKIPEEGGKKEGEEANLINFEITPSCEGEAGWILYQKGAKATAGGENLSKVKFWISPTGTGMEDVLFKENEIIKKDNQWEVLLPDMMYVTNFYAIGYDSSGKQVGKISLGNIYGKEGYPKDCKETPIAFCGNGKIDTGETSENCCIDAGCSSGKICKQNKCVSENVVATKKGDDFYNLAEYFAVKKNTELVIFKNVDELVLQLRNLSPIYLAIVLSPQELTPDFIDEVDEKLRNIDNDLFLDVAYGIITSFTIEDGYIYVDKLLDYKTPGDLSIYGINQDYHFRRLKEWYGIDLFDRCVGGYGMSLCDDEHRATIDRIVKEAKNSEILNFGLHGSPNVMALDGGELLRGNMNGLIGEKPTTENVTISLNAALVNTFSCLTSRINGKPSVVHEEYGDTEIEGNVNTSIVLSILKSGALNYIGATHVANLGVIPAETLVLEAILQGKPIGIALKDFKNNYIFNKIFESRTLEGKPKASDFMIGFIEFQVKNWVLFGDPSISVSNKNIKPRDCVQQYEESSNIQNINGENYLMKDVETTIKFEENGAGITNTQLVNLLEDDVTKGSPNDACAIHIPLEGRLVKWNVSYEGINEMYSSYFKENGIIENGGDELIIIIPPWVPVGGNYGTVKLNFSIKMVID